MIYAGRDLSHVLKVERIDRALVPPVDASTTDVGGVDGAPFGSASLGALEITVAVRWFALASGADRAALHEARRREVAGLVYKGGLRKLVLDDAPDAWYMAILTGSTPVERLVHSASAELTFLCPDPAAHGAPRRRRKPAGGTMAVDVGGNYPTAPVVTVEADGGEVEIHFDGAPFRVLGTHAGSVAVDAANHVAVASGLAVPVDIECDYPSWEPGRHEVSCPLPFKVEWEERWI